MYIRGWVIKDGVPHSASRQSRGSARGNHKEKKEMTYYSKRYLKEKWEALKWDMDMLLANEDDRIDEEKVKRVRNEMNYYIDAIKKEINK